MPNNKAILLAAFQDIRPAEVQAAVIDAFLEGNVAQDWIFQESKTSVPPLKINGEASKEEDIAKWLKLLAANGQIKADSSASPPSLDTIAKRISENSTLKKSAAVSSGAYTHSLDETPEAKAKEKILDALVPILFDPKHLSQWVSEANTPFSTEIKLNEKGKPLEPPTRYNIHTRLGRLATAVQEWKLGKISVHTALTNVIDIIDGAHAVLSLTRPVTQDYPEIKQFRKTKEQDKPLSSIHDIPKYNDRKKYQHLQIYAALYRATKEISGSNPSLANLTAASTQLGKDLDKIKSEILGPSGPTTDTEKKEEILRSDTITHGAPPTISDLAPHITPVTTIEEKKSSPDDVFDKLVEKLKEKKEYTTSAMKENLRTWITNKIADINKIPVTTTDEKEKAERQAQFLVEYLKPANRDRLRLKESIQKKGLAGSDADNLAQGILDLNISAFIATKPKSTFKASIASPAFVAEKKNSKAPGKTGIHSIPGKTELKTPVSGGAITADGSIGVHTMLDRKVEIIRAINGADLKAMPDLDATAGFDAVRIYLEKNEVELKLSAQGVPSFRGHTNDGVVLQDGNTAEVRNAILDRRRFLIRYEITAKTGVAANLNTLPLTLTAGADGDAVRKYLDDSKAHFGIDFTGHLTDEHILANADTNAIRDAIRQKQHTLLLAEITTKTGTANLNTLPLTLTAGADGDAVRKYLDDNKAHFGIDFTGHLTDEHILANADTDAIRDAIRQKQHTLLLAAITAKTGTANLNTLPLTLTAGADGDAVRKYLDDNKAHFGIDFTGHLTDEHILANADTDAIRDAIRQKQHTLLLAAITAKTGTANLNTLPLTLTAGADGDAVRKYLDDNKAHFGIDFTGHLTDEHILANADTDAIRDAIRQKQHTLLLAEITAKTGAANLNTLPLTLTAGANGDAVRKYLDDNKAHFGINFTGHLTDEHILANADTDAIRDAIRQKQHTLLLAEITAKTGAANLNTLPLTLTAGANGDAVRKYLDDNKAHFGINFTGHLTDEHILANADTDAIRDAIRQKQHTLLLAEITAKTGAANLNTLPLTLTAGADGDAVRKYLNDNKAHFGIDFTGHLTDEHILANADTDAIRDAIHARQRALLPAEITAKISGATLTQLPPDLKADAGNDAVRKYLDDNKAYFRIDFTGHLADEHVLANATTDAIRDAIHAQRRILLLTDINTKITNATLTDLPLLKSSADQDAVRKYLDDNKAYFSIDFTGHLADGHLLTNASADIIKSAIISKRNSLIADEVFKALNTPSIGTTQLALSHEYKTTDFKKFIANNIAIIQELSEKTKTPADIADALKDVLKTNATDPSVIASALTSKLAISVTDINSFNNLVNSIVNINKAVLAPDPTKLADLLQKARLADKNPISETKLEFYSSKCEIMRKGMGDPSARTKLEAAWNAGLENPRRAIENRIAELKELRGELKKHEDYKRVESLEAHGIIAPRRITVKEAFSTGKSGYFETADYNPNKCGPFFTAMGFKTWNGREFESGLNGTSLDLAAKEKRVADQILEGYKSAKYGTPKPSELSLSLDAQIGNLESHLKIMEDTKAMIQSPTLKGKSIVGRVVHTEDLGSIKFQATDDEKSAQTEIASRLSALGVPSGSANALSLASTPTGHTKQFGKGSDLVILGITDSAVSGDKKREVQTVYTLGEVPTNAGNTQVKLTVHKMREDLSKLPMLVEVSLKLNLPTLPPLSPSTSPVPTQEERLKAFWSNYKGEMTQQGIESFLKAEEAAGRCEIDTKTFQKHSTALREAAQRICHEYAQVIGPIKYSMATQFVEDFKNATHGTESPVLRGNDKELILAVKTVCEAMKRLTGDKKNKAYQYTSPSDNTRPPSEAQIETAMGFLLKQGFLGEKASTPEAKKMQTQLLHEEKRDTLTRKDARDLPKVEERTEQIKFKKS